ncbi:MAG TPA: hypothetical protein VMC07_01595 [Candidatus Omnitrophota bacterium]|nr:hypothetical protein [Candidatus Omnitrophota bacterium]
MFGKKTCRRCGGNVRKKYDFCPYCGNALEKSNEDFGMLGKNDFFNENALNEMRMPSGFNMLFNSLMKNFEKQLRDAEKRNEKPDDKKGHISISISTLGNKAPVIKVSPPAEKPRMKRERKVSFGNLSLEQLKKFSSLPKEEPKTSIRRISNKVLYELEIPGVKSAKDISILNLEKGVELKALSDKIAYLKSIPITLPIINYKFSKGKLVLEMDGEN